MEIINELLSDNIDYLNALRNAEPLPKTDSTTLNLSIVIKFALIAGVLSLLVYIVFKTRKDEKEKNENLNKL